VRTSNDPVIIMEHVSKTFALETTRKRDLKSTLKQSYFHFGLHHESFNALDDINLELYQGDVLGIVGANGSGKTTLLKLLARVSAPSAGRILIRGTLSAMLEVRIGFHPDLSGIENIFLYGALMGMKRNEIKSHLESIIAFADLEKFILTPVKSYSSGMYVRLAFAVVVHLPSDILILDEVLNYIDIEFQQKCVDKLLEFKQQKRTMILVGHQLSLLNTLCSRGIFIHEGTIRYSGSMEETTKTYQEFFHDRPKIR
jgi:lipopolysaccharide transport system ATP-binding protein